MNAQRCARWPAVEAAGLASPEALPEGELRDHLATCEVCQRALGDDSAILQALRASPPPAWSGDGRETLRAALAPEKVAAAQRRKRNRNLIAGSLGSAGLASLVLWLQLTEAPLPPTQFTLAPAMGASFETLESGPATRLRLASGALSVHVEHLQAGQRFEMELPDGRLAVRGTRFTVTVEAGQTRSVEVAEGRVELWTQGEHRLVSAGERWQATLPVAEVVASPQPAAGPEGSDAGSGEASGVGTAAEQPAPLPKVERAERSVAPPRKEANPTGFPEAVQSFRERDYAGAEKAFKTFMEAHPADRRSEDALFLRIRALQYLGRETEARDEAANYLKRFPEGLRRPEVEQVVAP